MAVALSAVAAGWWTVASLTDLSTVPAWALAAGALILAVALLALAGTAKRSAARRRSAAVLREGREKVAGVVRIALVEPTTAVLDERDRVEELTAVAQAGHSTDPSPARPPA